MDGDVTTRFANSMLAFLCAASEASKSSTVFEGKVVLTVVVAIGTYISLSGLPPPSSILIAIEIAASKA